MTTIKKHKTETPGYYFTYTQKQHPMFKHQTEKWALLYEESNGQMISELNTEADKVHGMDKFTHKEVIGWFDSILNPSMKILSGVQLIEEERRRQIKIEKFDITKDIENYGSGQLVGAAMCYAANAVNKMHNEDVLRAQISEHPEHKDWSDAWPWSAEWDKRKKHDQKRSLVIAGALIAAELDRLSAEEKQITEI